MHLGSVILAGRRTAQQPGCAPDFDKLSEFGPIKARFLPDETQYWNRAVKFFNRKGLTFVTPIRHRS